MRDTLRCLIQLQQIDIQIHEILQMQDACRAREQELAQQVDEQSKALEDTKTRHEARSTEREEKSTLLTKEQDKLQKWERRLMESKNSREASALSREIDTQKRLNLEAEEEVLRLLGEEEELHKSLTELDTSVTALRSELATESAEAEAKAAEFDGSLSEKRSLREELVQSLQRSLLNKYENIRKLRGGIAVVAAASGRCTGCNMRLRPQLYNIILRAQSLETCPSCKRILYSEEGLADGS